MTSLCPQILLVGISRLRACRCNPSIEFAIPLSRGYTTADTATHFSNPTHARKPNTFSQNPAHLGSFSEITTHLSKTDTARSGDLPTRPDPSCHGVTQSSLLPPSSPPPPPRCSRTRKRHAAELDVEQGKRAGARRGTGSSRDQWQLYQDDGYNCSSSTTLCRCSTRDSFLTALEDGSPALTGAGTDGARQFQGGNACIDFVQKLEKYDPITTRIAIRELEKVCRGVGFQDASTEY
ncbi:hypothetical protein C8R45DRAFT_1179056 [Mycena sanguinolenta]|nr:hypothetical protein C8R45DRAFT_1179056 [Mycena sanguinolenta]